MTPFIDIHCHNRDIIPCEYQFIELNNILYPQKPVSPNDLISLHPSFLPDLESQAIEYLEVNYQEGQILGEIGLDKVAKTPWDKQVTFYRTALKFAVKKKIKAITLHSVKAHQDCLKYITLEKYQGHFIFHDYFSSKEELLQILKYPHAYISLGSILRRPQSKLYHDLKSIPLERVFLETDEADVSIEDQYKKFCLITNQNLDHVKKICYDSYLKVSGEI